MNSELMKALRPVKNRLRRNRFLRGAAAGLAAGLGAAALLQAASFFTPVPDRGLWAAATAAAVSLLTAAGNALRPVRNTEAAKAADACGLKERVITALEGEALETACRDNSARADIIRNRRSLQREPVLPGGTESAILLLQRKDACSALEKLDVKKIRPGSVRKALAAAMGCAVLTVCLMLIPNAQDSAAEAGKALNRTLREGWEAIARAAEEDQGNLTEKKKNELRKITEDLNRELDESRDAADAMVALFRAEQRVEELRQRTAGDAAAADAAAGGDESRNVGHSDQSGHTGEPGEAGTAAQAVSGPEQAALTGTAPTAAQLKTLQAIAALKSAVNPSLQYGMYAKAGMQGSQNGGGSSGAGGVNNSDRAGSGAGEGSTNEEQTGSGKSGTGVHIEGNRPPKYKEEQYETIYDPEHIDKAKQDTATDQNRLSDEDSLQLETGPGRGQLSGDVPWSEALQEYAETEARSADRENLTVQERQWVDEYYRLLTEQK